MKNKAAQDLVSLRWSKEIPDPDYFKKIGKKGAKKRWGKKKKKVIHSTILTGNKDQVV